MTPPLTGHLASTSIRVVDDVIVLLLELTNATSVDWPVKLFHRPAHFVAWHLRVAAGDTPIDHELDVCISYIRDLPPDRVLEPGESCRRVFPLEIKPVWTSVTGNCFPTTPHQSLDAWFELKTVCTPRFRLPTYKEKQRILRSGPRLA